jgi:6-phosphogluconolactonase
MNFRIFEDASALAAGAAEAIINRVRAGDRIIALSGGSSPRPLYEMLGRNDELRAAPVTWVVVDERFVPFADPQSNARMIHETLFARGVAPGHRFLKFETDVPDAAASATTFEAEWRRLGIERLDLALLGMGDDGHTASLFPGTPVLDVSDRIAAAVYVPRLDSWRVTLTMPVLREAKARWLLAAGSAKRKVLEEIRSGADYPVARVMSVTDSWWFVDRAAVEG